MEEQQMSVEAQLAVIRTKVDQLIDLNKTRGADHEERIRTLEQTRPDYITRRGAVALVAVVCTVVTAASNIASFMLR